MNHLNVEQKEVIVCIKETAKRILSQGLSLWLYGSRARGNVDRNIK